MRIPALLALGALAGCLAPGSAPGIAPDATDGADAWAEVRALLADVPCEAEVGEGTSANLRRLAHVPRGAEEDGVLGEIDVHGDLLLVARIFGGGLDVVDVSDPLRPATLARWRPEGSERALDVKWLPDGRGAVVGDRDRIHVLDLADPASPRVASVFAFEDAGIRGQAHMMAVAEVAGEEWLFVATQTAREPMHVLRVDGFALEHVTSYGLPVVGSAPLGNHDPYYVEDELRGGAPTLYLSDGLAGWVALDVSDPAKPERVGGSPSLEPGPGYTHTVRTWFTDGKRVVVTMSEVGANSLKVYDATALEAPVLLATWQADRARPLVPQHNIQVLDGLVYLAHYTEGMYVVDVRGAVEGPPLAGTLAVEPVARWAVEEPGEPSALGFANAIDVVVVDGLLHVTDMTAGLYTLGFGCLEAGDAAARATA